MSFTMGMAVGVALASSKGLTAGQLATSAAIGIPLGIAAGVGAAAVVKNPRAMNIVRFGVGAAVLSPFLAAEDLLRATGVKVPAKGVLYNDEGASIWQIWNEASPSWNGNI